MSGPDVEGVLAGHGYVGHWNSEVDDGWTGCTGCNWRTETGAFSNYSAHRAHVAAVLREQIAAWLGSEGLREIAAYAVERAEKPKNATYDDVARAALAALAAQVAPSRVPGEGS